MAFTFFGGGGGAAAETVDVTAGETLAAGEVVALSLGAPGTAGQAYLADASDPRLSSAGAVLGIVETGGAASATVTITLNGTATVAGLTSGKFYGISSSTPGALALTADTPTIGYASSATELKLSGLVEGLSSLSAGVAYTSDGSGDLTAATAGGFGWALSATTLQITPRAWADSARPLGDNCYIAGGRTDNGSGTTVDDIDTFPISTLGNASGFGELNANINSASGSCSLVRALWAGGEIYPTSQNRISFQDVASGSALGDFGDLTVARKYAGSASDGVLAIIGGGDSNGTKSDVIDKVTIATTGNSVDVGDLDAATTGECAMGNALKAFFCGGEAAAGFLDTIQTCTWASLTNAADHSNLTAARGYAKAASNSTHGLIFGGYSGSWHDEIDRLDLATTDDATDWGDLAANNAFAAGAGANATRAVFCGGRTVAGAPTVNEIQYASLASATGTIADFGDLTSNRNRAAGTSTGNGGLQ